MQAMLYWCPRLCSAILVDRLGMNIQFARKYLFTCGLLLLPVFVWNILFWRYLPPAFEAGEFWRDIPSTLAMAEHSLRLLIFTLPFFMPLGISGARQRTGLGILIAGNLLYFASWLALIIAPNSLWSQSAIGFLAPAYTPILWLLGLAMLSGQLFWGTFYRWWIYLVFSGLFIAVHVTHAAVVYIRNY